MWLIYFKSSLFFKGTIKQKNRELGKYSYPRPVKSMFGKERLQKEKIWTPRNN
jgi:hypothetical protein